MQLTSSPRRALGLVAVGALGMSTAVLGVTGVAQAAPLEPITFTDTQDHGVYKILDGYCSVDWTIVGAQGGANSEGAVGAAGGELVLTTPTVAGREYFLFAGGVGGDATDGGAGGAVSGVATTDYDGKDGEPGAGGGGAASFVTMGDLPLYVAFGGDGAGLAPALGGEGAGNGENFSHDAPLSPEQTNALSAGGPGSVTGIAQPCPPAPAPEQPGTPTVNWISAGEKSAQLQIWQGYLPEGAASTPVYEYSLDGGAWKKLATSGEFQIEPTITGLVNGKTYSVRVRVTVDGVSSEPTAAQKVTPRHFVGQPTNVTTTTGPGSLTISWAPPADPTGITGYEVWAIPGAEPQSNHGQVDCPALDASARSCTIGVPVGSVYSVAVRALDANGGGYPARAVSGEVTAAVAASSLPTSTGTLSTDRGAVSTVPAGGTVTLTGGGYLPYSTVTLIMYSTPVVLGTTVADAAGNISATVTLPAGVTGTHNLVASGVDPSGAPHNLTMTVTVSASGLPNTGASIALPALGGLAALAAGGGLLFAARRRTAA